MSNDTRCRATAARYASLAFAASNEELRRSYRELERLWLAVAELSESLERQSGAGSNERIVAIVELVHGYRKGLH